jgi:hypothetical protein
MVPVPIFPIFPLSPFFPHFSGISNIQTSFEGGEGDRPAPAELSRDACEPFIAGGLFYVLRRHKEVPAMCLISLNAELVARR